MITAAITTASMSMMPTIRSRHLYMVVPPSLGRFVRAPLLTAQLLLIRAGWTKLAHRRASAIVVEARKDIHKIITELTTIAITEDWTPEQMKARVLSLVAFSKGHAQMLAAIAINGTGNPSHRR